MRLSSLVSLGSLLALASLGTGCFFVGDNSGGDGSGTPAPETTAQTVLIDTDATITASPGDGVGVFVQYASGGHWTIFTTCDTHVSNASCGFDLYVNTTDPQAELSKAQGTDLAGRDGIEMLADGSIHLSTDTSTGSNGFTFDATPGAIVELNMALDGASQERFVYWVGNGILHTGAPSNPVDFQPTATASSSK
jgi:hypothetical protein